MRGDLPQELQGVSVRELVKAIGESRANGNGTTPPRTPPPTPRKVPRSRSSSPRVAAIPPGASSGGTSLFVVPASPPATSLEDAEEHIVPDVVEKGKGLSRASSPIPIPGTFTRCVI